MDIIGRAKKVTIYIGESDRWERQPLYAAILEMLRRENCAGATVTRALAGFGAHSRIHTAGLVDLSSDLPLIIEWVDSPHRVTRILPKLRAMVSEGLITVQVVEVVTYSHRRLRQLSAILPVSDVMNREVQAIPPETPLVAVVERLLRESFRALPVIDEQRRVIGLITDGTLIRQAGLLATSAQAKLTQAELAAHLQQLHQSGQTAAELMIPDPLTVNTDTPLNAAITLMIEQRIKRLPVVDDQGRLQGILSRLDVLRALSQMPLGALPRPDPPPGMHRRVAAIMNPNVPTVTEQASLAEVVNLLVGSIQRRVIVVNQAGRVVGIITDGDLIERAGGEERQGIIRSLSRLPLGRPEQVQLARRTAGEVMTSPVITVTPETPLTEALQYLLTHQIKRLPVVDQAGQLVGLVGRSGILQVLGREIGTETEA